MSSAVLPVGLSTSIPKVLRSTWWIWVAELISWAAGNSKVVKVGVSVVELSVKTFVASLLNAILSISLSKSSRASNVSPSRLKAVVALNFPNPPIKSKI